MTLSILLNVFFIFGSFSVQQVSLQQEEIDLSNAFREFVDKSAAEINGLMEVEKQKFDEIQAQVRALIDQKVQEAGQVVEVLD